MKIQIAAVQMPVGHSISQNAGQICTAIERAADAGAMILLTPEGSLSGYSHDFDPRAVRSALRRVTALARRHSVGLALGTCFLEDDGHRYNQIRFYRPDGEYLGFHSKILLCGTLGSGSSGEINHYGTTALRAFIWSQGLVIGGLICNDLWANPECTSMPDSHVTQLLSGMGARIIFHAVNGGRDGDEISRLNWQYHEANLRLRARAGRIWIVTVDNANPISLPCSSPSGVIDPQGNWVYRTEPIGAQFFTWNIELPRRHSLGNAISP